MIFRPSHFFFHPYAQSNPRFSIFTCSIKACAHQDLFLDQPHSNSPCPRLVLPPSPCTLGLPSMRKYTHKRSPIPALIAMAMAAMAKHHMQQPLLARTWEGMGPRVKGGRALPLRCVIPWDPRRKVGVHAECMYLGAQGRRSVHGWKSDDGGGWGMWNVEREREARIYIYYFYVYILCTCIVRSSPWCLCCSCLSCLAQA